MKAVYSSHIDAIGYDPQNQILTVQWDKDGGSTMYFGVPPEVARGVIDAPSIGEALHQHVRGKYEHRTVKG